MLNRFYCNYFHIYCDYDIVHCWLLEMSFLNHNENKLWKEFWMVMIWHMLGSVPNKRLNSKIKNYRAAQDVKQALSLFIPVGIRHRHRKKQSFKTVKDNKRVLFSLPYLTLNISIEGFLFRERLLWVKLFCNHYKSSLTYRIKSTQYNYMFIKIQNIFVGHTACPTASNMSLMDSFYNLLLTKIRSSNSQ